MTRNVCQGGALLVFTTILFGSAGRLNAQILPPPWTTRDVGKPAREGEAELSSGIFTIAGAGEGFGDTSDQFRFVYQPVSGDVEIVARVTSLGGTDGNAAAGIMIRSRAGARATHATLSATLLNGWEFHRRVAARSRRFCTRGPAGRSPGWIKLVREGDLFSAYHSADGAKWTLIDSDRIAMPDNVLVGLAVASDNPFSAALATFASVVIRRVGGPNEPPTVSILSPSGGERFAVGGSIAIRAAASDEDGAVTRVDFYRGSSLLASDTIAPYSATWTGATAGSHSLSAVARDTDGATTSASVSIFVGSTAPPARATLVFTPSADHGKNVTAYWLTVFRATDPLTAAPVVKMNLGKPIPSDGEISLDVSSLLSLLRTGSYKVVVTAVGAGGSAASRPSPSFAR